MDKSRESFTDNLPRKKHKIRLPPLTDVDEEKEVEKWEIKHLPSDWSK